MVVDIQKNGAENEFPHILGHLARYEKSNLQIYFFINFLNIIFLHYIYSYSVGRSTKDQQICNDLFICPTSAEVLILDGMQDQGNFLYIFDKN